MLNHTISSKIDYTLLDNSASNQEIIDLCKKANEFQVCSVCVMPKHVSIARNELSKSSVLVCTVISFPEGINSIEDKVKEIEEVIAFGADEIDIVLNYNKIDDPEYLLKEIISCEKIIHQHQNKNKENIILKVIVESGLLTFDQTKLATDICIQAKADFIKTSTGKVAVGAEIEKVKQMKEVIDKQKSTLKIKASGGIRNIHQIEEYNSLVDRFGIGFKSVDDMMGQGDNLNSDY